MRCASCHATFPLNQALVTVPEGVQIAFDPVHGLVWRICKKCGTWNQLDGQAVTRAMPELKARFAAIWSVASGGLAISQLGLPGMSCELIRVDEVGDADWLRTLLNNRPVELRDKWKWLKWLGAVAFAIAVFVLTFLASHQWRTDILFEMIPVVLAIAIGSASALCLLDGSKHLRQGRYARGLKMLAASGVSAALMGLLLHNAALMLLIPALTALVPILSWPFSRIRSGVQLPSGRRVKYAFWEIREFRLTWTLEPEEFQLRLPVNGELNAGDSAAMLHRMSSGLSSLAVPALEDQAHALVHNLGGLRGVLGLLDDWRLANGGSVQLGNLPMVYQIAIDWASQQSITAGKTVSIGVPAIPPL